MKIIYYKRQKLTTVKGKTNSLQKIVMKKQYLFLTCSKFFLLQICPATSLTTRECSQHTTLRFVNVKHYWVLHVARIRWRQRIWSNCLLSLLTWEYCTCCNVFRHNRGTKSKHEYGSNVLFYNETENFLKSNRSKVLVTWTYNVRMRQWSCSDWEGKKA